MKASSKPPVGDLRTWLVLAIGAMLVATVFYTQEVAESPNLLVQYAAEILLPAYAGAVFLGIYFRPAFCALFEALSDLSKEHTILIFQFGRESWLIGGVGMLLAAGVVAWFRLGLLGSG